LKNPIFRAPKASLPDAQWRRRRRRCPTDISILGCPFSRTSRECITTGENQDLRDPGSKSHAKVGTCLTLVHKTKPKKRIMAASKENLMDITQSVTKAPRGRKSSQKYVKAPPRVEVSYINCFGDLKTWKVSALRPWNQWSTRLRVMKNCTDAHTLDVYNRQEKFAEEETEWQAYLASQLPPPPVSPTKEEESSEDDIEVWSSPEVPSKVLSQARLPVFEAIAPSVSQKRKREPIDEWSEEVEREYLRLKAARKLQRAGR